MSFFFNVILQQLAFGKSHWNDFSSFLVNFEKNSMEIILRKILWKLRDLGINIFSDLTKFHTEIDRQAKSFPTLHISLDWQLAMIIFSGSTLNIFLGSPSQAKPCPLWLYHRHACIYIYTYYIYIYIYIHIYKCAEYRAPTHIHTHSTHTLTSLDVVCVMEHWRQCVTTARHREHAAQ